MPRKPKCQACGGLGFLAGAHTERVEPCPTCAESDTPAATSPDYLVAALEEAEEWINNPNYRRLSREAWQRKNSA